MSRDNPVTPSRKLRRALQSPKAQFVAIDEEFTGISFNNGSFRT